MSNTDELRAAAHQALAAMEKYPVTVNHWKAVLLPAADALRAALAQPAAPAAPAEPASLDTPGNRHPEYRYAGYKNEPLKAGATDDQRKAWEAGKAAQARPACKGMNCGATDGLLHSLECQAEHAAAIAGGEVVKWRRAAEPASEPVARWYCVSRDGAATLCVDEEDALEVAAESFVGWPQNGPYRAVQMAEVRPQPAPARVPLTDALQMIAWSNDSAWQAQCAREALAAAGITPAKEAP